jgi:NodT family efflux transporter outer membrane factor (OMF) lipoprotein
MNVGCSTGPTYKKPTNNIPVHFKEGHGTEMAFAPAKPKDEASHGKWWEVFHDPVLSGLESQVNVNNQNIAAAFANFKAAKAIVRQAQAQYFPSVSVAPSVTSQTVPILPGAAPVNDTEYAISADASWAPDLFGRVQNLVKQDIAAAQVSAADLENTRLLAAATLAIDYFQLRTQDALIDLLDATVVAYSQQLELTRSLFQSGIDSEEAVAQAQTQLESTQAQATGLKIARAQYEHAIALLVGQPASIFFLSKTPSPMMTFAAPPIPLGVPSQLLERRPDVAASERSVAAANAQIGVAMAAYFPTLTLTGSAGLENSTFSTLLSAPNFIWSLGATLAETVFDGGLRSAKVDQYRAAYEQTVAAYRQTVLTAFQQVEDGLAGLHYLSLQTSQQDRAVQSAQHTLQIVMDRYQLGIDPYLNVLLAQITLLGNQQTAMGIRLQQMTTSVQLIEALGGGWDTSRLPSENDIK